MKKYFLIITLALFTLGMSMTSCSKDDDDPVVDPRDQYVGTWNSKEIGSITIYSEGSSIGTSPIDKSSTISISKTGEKSLIIDEKYFIVNDNNLSSDTESFTQTEDGVNIVGTATYTGLLGSNTISINTSITGTWSSEDGSTGNISGTSVITLTK